MTRSVPQLESTRMWLWSMCSGWWYAHSCWAQPESIIDKKRVKEAIFLKVKDMSKAFVASNKFNIKACKPKSGRRKEE